MTAEDTIKLGLMPPLTGLVGIYGSEIVHAGQIACEEINENGGVLGRPLELVIEDDGSLPESSVAAAEKLVEKHQCSAIIGNLLSNSRIAVAYRIAEPRKIPYLNFSFYEGSILSRYFFHFAALPNQQIDMMIPYMAKHFGSNMFFAGNNYEWPRGSIQAAKQALEKCNGVIVGEEYTNIGVSREEIEQLLDHVEAANPDVFVPYFAGTDQILLLTQFTKRGLKKNIKVVMGHYDEILASKLSPEVREGFYSSNTYFMSLNTTENQNYLQRLAKLSDVDGIWPEGNGFLTNFGEGTYLCVKAFATAVNKAGSLDSETLVDTLKTITILSPQGRVQMNPEHQHATINTYLSRCRADGVFEIVESFGAIKAEIPTRYAHQQISSQATLEEDIRLQSRILEQMNEAVLLVNSAEGSIVYSNSGAEKMFGYDAKGMNNLTIESFDTLATSQTTKEIVTVLNMKGEWQGETQLIKKNGIQIWCSISITTFSHPVHGEVWLWVANDITERVLATANLRESEEKYRLAMDANQGGLWDWNITTGSVYYSPGWKTILGMKTLQNNYDAWESRIFPEDKSRILDSLHSHLNAETLVWQEEYRLRHTSTAPSNY
ncbi:MAG: ABC transporter substrate-binding protein, partial [Methylococcales bacterium]|nr:ABC transporter substrate-binding protein [Methylococcales bacterium]